MVFTGVVRDSWVISAKHPDYADHPCKNEDCNRLGCAGDRLERCSADEAGKYKVVIEHHKTEDHHDGQPIEFVLPPTWTLAIQPWVEHGHAVAANGCP